MTGSLILERLVDRHSNVIVDPVVPLENCTLNVVEDASEGMELSSDRRQVKQETAP
jgi:hypothetical protein